MKESLFAYDVKGSGPVLVLLHGFTGSKQTWKNFTEAWQDRFTLVTVDLPGHGDTPPFSHSMPDLVEQLHDFFKQLNLTKFHLLGYSMGGRIALSYANVYPEKIQSLILESASPGLKDEEERKERRESDERLATRIENDGLEPFVDFWEEIPLFMTQKKLPLEKRRAIRKERLSHTTEGLAHSLRTIGTGSQPSLWDKLSEMKIPTCLIVGDLDQKFVNINSRMQEKIARSELNVVEGTGHAIHVEDIEKFGKIVISFISRFNE